MKQETKGFFPCSYKLSTKSLVSVTANLAKNKSIQFLSNGLKMLFIAEKIIEYLVLTF